MKAALTILLIALSFSSFARRGSNARTTLKINQFTTDGCSAYPDGYLHTSENEWLHCCFAHDISYWVGGTQEEKVAADAELNRCVSESSFDAHGTMMELGVATGGTPYLATSWRWGYGWNKSVGFNELDLKKVKMINDKAYTILNALSMESFYMNDEQIDYVMEKFSIFRANLLNKVHE